MPEKYATGEDLAKAYSELSSKLGKSDEELRAAVTKELGDAALADRPATSGDYQLPDSIDDKTAFDNDLMQWWANHSFEKGYGQEAFEEGIEVYRKAFEGSQIDMVAEEAKLGDNSKVRIESASAFANKFFPKEAMPAIERMCETSDGIVALEHIMEKMKSTSVTNEASSPAAITEGDLHTMMRDDRYHHPTKRDPAFVKKVEQGFEKLYG